jgi:uncharacterized membrane protein YkvA (DUF1232 family)
MRSISGWLARTRRFQQQALALYMALRDSRTPLFSKMLAVMAVAYAISPVDLLPDPVPLLGMVDDALLVPLGLWLAARMIPAEVMADCRAELAARRQARRGFWRPALLVLTCALAVGTLAYWLIQHFST